MLPNCMELHLCVLSKNVYSVLLKCGQFIIPKSESCTKISQLDFGYEHLFFIFSTENKKQALFAFYDQCK